MSRVSLTPAEAVQLELIAADLALALSCEPEPDMALAAYRAWQHSVRARRSEVSRDADA